MKKRFAYTLLLAALAVNFLLGARVYLLHAEGGGQDNVYENMELFTRVLERVRKDYVDGDKVTYQELIHGALKGMLSTLDPHSEFMEVDKYQDLKDDTEGAFGGVGIVVGMRDNVLTVVAPMEDTPAFRAGILTGDRLIEIDGRSTEKLTLPDAVKRLRGAPGTDVVVTTLRPATGQSREVKLTRAEIKVETVKDINNSREFPLGEEGIGYIRLTQFGEQTSHELEEALKKLKKQGMQSLVLDLRGNPGGLLEQAAKVCDKFLPRNQLIVTTEGRRSDDRSEFRSTGRGGFANLRLAILVNNGSASASEIVAGCLQDTTAAGVTKATVFGEQTFGKGSVQKILPLQDGSALRLTTAKYYTPSHKVIHEHGITPDFTVMMTEEEEQALADRRAPGGVEALDDERRARATSARDVQLERAVDFLKGIQIYADRVKPDQQAAAAGSDKVSASR